VAKWKALPLAAALATAGAAYADEVAIPRDAYRYQRELIGHARAVWGLSAPVATFAGQIAQESAWNAEARSRVGASGLAQFMPGTADWIAGLYRSELGENQPLNPSWALRALVRYDRFLWDRVKPADTDCDRMAFALSAYNGGETRVRARQRASTRSGAYAYTGRINPGISGGNQRENEEYAPRILKRWQPRYLSWGIGIDCEGVL
jgi:soluble lytic murein transglycosylase-like protein